MKHGWGIFRSENGEVYEGSYIKGDAMSLITRLFEVVNQFGIVNVCSFCSTATMLSLRIYCTSFVSILLF